MSEYRQHADVEELFQARTRVGVTLTVAAILGLLGLTGLRPWDVRLQHATLGVTAYGALSLLWLVYVQRMPGRHRPRRVVGMVMDMAITTAALAVSGSRAPFFYPVYLWVIVSNGLRYGRRHLVAGMVLGVAGFGWLLAANSFWSSQRPIGIGLLAALVALPLFYLSILGRLHKLGARLEQELARSKAAEKAKGDFLANMTHEIRTPMNGVLGMVEVLEDAPLGDEERGHVRVIGRSAEALLRIINDILDYSKIASGKLTLEEVPFDLHEVLTDVEHLLRPTADDKALSLELDWPADAPRYYVGDPVRVRQIVFNLVGNAIKFTEHGGVEIRCRTGAAADGRRQVAVAVEDTGVGIPPDRLEAVFEQFEQADASTTRRFGGTGLGLSICRQLAGLMGGRVEARSEAGRGSVFTLELTLPVSEAPPAHTLCRRDDLPDYGLRVLVAEDNPLSRVVAGKLLQRLGITSEFADNGADAVRLAAGGGFDLVLMDVRMPGMDGFEATRCIRALPGAAARVPIVALTADATSSDAGHCLAVGMDASLVKPLRTGDVITVLDGLGIAAPQTTPS